jgi:hypothetical protein
VIITGAGVTISATSDENGKPLPRTTWKGLILDGWRYLVQTCNVDQSGFAMEVARKALDNSNSESLIFAADIVKKELDKKNKFPTWLASVFENLDNEVRHPAILKVLKALHSKGAKLLTTNYDDVLEKVCNLPSIGRSEKDLRKYKRGGLNGVFHIHGSYDEPDEIVLDQIGYYQITNADEVQDLLKTYLEHKLILFVGCGSGLEDPNFTGLLKWTSERHKKLSNWHCLLVQNEDKMDYDPLVRLKYGARHEDLVPYLAQLLDDPTLFAEVTSTFPDESSRE